MNRWKVAQNILSKTWVAWNDEDMKENPTHCGARRTSAPRPRPTCTSIQTGEAMTNNYQRKQQLFTLFMLPLVGFNGLVLALVLKLHIKMVRRKYEKMEAQRW